MAAVAVGYFDPWAYSAIENLQAQISIAWLELESRHYKQPRPGYLVCAIANVSVIWILTVS